MRTFLYSLLIGLVCRGSTYAGEPTALTAQVRAIIEAKCSQCHGDHLKEPEGKFGFVRDLAKLSATQALIVRGQPDQSELLKKIRNNEMPPPNSKVAALSDKEKELFDHWIRAGAPPELSSDWQAIAASLAKGKSTSGKSPVELNKGQAAVQIKGAELDIEMMDKPAGEIFKKIGELTSIKVLYTKPQREPKLSIKLKNGTLGEAIDYLVLCGNLSAVWSDDRVVIQPYKPTSKKPAKSKSK